jgi:hypothetical protein
MVKHVIQTTHMQDILVEGAAPGGDAAGGAPPHLRGLVFMIKLQKVTFFGRTLRFRHIKIGKETPVLTLISVVGPSPLGGGRVLIILQMWFTSVAIEYSPEI